MNAIHTWYKTQHMQQLQHKKPNNHIDKNSKLMDPNGKILAEVRKKHFKRGKALNSPKLLPHATKHHCDVDKPGNDRLHVPF